MRAHSADATFNGTGLALSYFASCLYSSALIASPECRRSIGTTFTSTSAAVAAESGFDRGELEKLLGRARSLEEDWHRESEQESRQHGKPYKKKKRFEGIFDIFD